MRDWVIATGCSLLSSALPSPAPAPSGAAANPRKVRYARRAVGIVTIARCGSADGGPIKEQVMPRFAHYVITWGEEAGRVPPAEGVGELASSAAANSGELLAVGPVHDVSERQARPVPEWLAVAGFRDPAGARAWVAGAQERLGTTTFAAPALTEPVWWPEEMTGQRVDWSRKPEPPLSRLGLFVVIWFELTDPVQFLDYSAHYKWTVEHAGGACLVGSPRRGAAARRYRARGAGGDGVA